jgi:tetratricopeptide (TPR) repeat protein
MSRLTGVVLALLLAFPLFAADPADPLIAQGEAALRAGNVDAAINLFKQAIAKSPKNAVAHYHLGDAYGDAALKAGLFSQMSLANKCKDEFLAAVALDPGYYDARLGLLEWYLQVPGIAGGSEEKALEQAAEIRKRDSLHGHLAYASIYRKQQKPELVRAEYAAMVKEQPSSAKAHYWYANYLINEKNLPGAAAELDTAVKLDGNYMPAWFQVGHVAALTGSDLARGEDALKRYLNYKPASDEPGLYRAHYWLGAIFEKLGKKAEAKAAYQTSLKINANQKDVQEALKRVS